MKYLVLLETMFRREILTLVRYPFNLIAGLVSVYLIFLIIFFGARSLMGENPGFGHTLEGIIVGFMMWFLAIMAYSDLAWSLTREAQQGTLEQLYMSPLGFSWVNTFRLMSALLINLVITLGLLIVMMVTSGRYLNLDVLRVLPLMLLTIAGIYGIGFIAGGAALVFKQVQSFLQILQFLFVGLIVAPIDRLPFLKYLPLALGTNLIGKVMVQGQSFTEIGVQNLLFLSVNSICYLFGGLLLFKFFENIAREKGLLGHY